MVFLTKNYLNPQMKRCRLIALILSAGLIAVAPSSAVILYGTDDPSVNTTAPAGALAGSGWQYEGRFGSYLGTVIASNYFITAKHIGGNVGQVFTFNGNSYTTTAVFRDTASDLAIWQVAGTFPFQAPLYSSPAGSEPNLALVVFGRGTRRGNPVFVGSDSHLGGWLWGVFDGVQRWGTNVIGSIFDDPTDGKLLRVPFDANAGPNEAHLSSGDSGGGVFVLNSSTNRWELAGVNLAVDGPFSISTDGSNPFNAAMFDTSALFVKSDQGDWITAPNPSAFYATEIAARRDFIQSIVGFTFYVSNRGNNAIEKFDASGTDLGTFANSGLNCPYGLAFDASGNLYAANFNNNTIEKFDSNGNPTLFANSGLNGPVGLAFDASGNLYAANFNNNTIEKFDVSGTDLGIFANSGLNGPYGLAFDTSGNLYVANNRNNTIERFDLSGNPTLFANSGLNGPVGLAFDPNGNLYAANLNNNTIERFDLSGNPTLFASSGLNGPVGLAFDPSGNLYAANGNINTIEKFDSTGSPTVFASLGLSYPVFIAVRLTPTPTIQVTVQTNPTGLTFTVDGTTYTTAQTFSWASGSSHAIATTSPQSGAAGVRYVWSKWSDSGTISHTVAPAKNTIYTATFTTQYYLTMSAGSGGTVSPSSGWKSSGTTVSITATPTNNTSVSYTFSSWTGSGTGSYSGTNNPASITMSGPITETPAFTQNPVNITVQTSLAGLSFTVDGTNYSAAQTFSWTPGSSHTIATTSPQSGAVGVRYVWSNWSGGGTISHTVAPTKNTIYTATFTTQYYLTMSAGTGGTVSPSSGWKNSGTIVSITATPTNNTSVSYTFSSWTGSGTGSYSGTNNPASITMSGPIMETAAFTP